MVPEVERAIEVQNTPEGWMQVSEQVEAGSALIIRTVLEDPLDDQQLFCLRYCFTALDRLELKTMAPQYFTLQIVVKHKSDAYRIQHYLAIMTALRNINVEILCGDGVIRGQYSLQNDYYRILPLFCVGAGSSQWAASYLTMALPGNTCAVQTQVDTSFQKESPQADDNKIASVQELLEQSWWQNVWHLQENISGTDEVRMSEDNKTALQYDLLKILRVELPRLGLLARLFWSLFLRSMSESKDLFYPGSDGVWHVDTESLRCTRLDAVSYAEGVFQLMENACIHSDMKRAYVSIRLNDIDMTAKGIERVAKAAQNRADIYKRHEQIWGKDAAQQDGSQPSPLAYEPDRQTKFCLDFSVLNDSIQFPAELWGIARMFAKNRKKDWNDTVLENVFSYQCEKMSDISKHYGLRLLEKTVQLNGGFFSVCSPGKKGYQDRYASFYRNGVKKVSRQVLSAMPCTEFNVLLPLYPHWHNADGIGEESAPPKSLFQQGTLTGKKYQQRVLRFQIEALETRRESKPFFVPESYLLDPKGIAERTSIWANDAIEGWLAGKEALVDEIWDQLRQTVGNAVAREIWLLDLMQVRDVLSLELLAKAIFLLIAWWKSEKKEGLKLAVLLPDEMLTSEFIRFFAIFYDKSLSTARWMGDTQVALCGYGEAAEVKFPGVHFLLAGETIGAARITARTFAYYNTDPTLELMPQIRYLTRMEKEESVPQFPFDLFLTAVPESTGDTSETSWFLRQMQQSLEQELWRRPHGCQLKGIRVRLHSNIYLSSFYEAELLFHNVGIIYRFAHLIVRDLLPQLPLDRKRPLAVVGYEFYSSVLTQQIALLLEEWADVHYLVYSTSQEGERLHFSPKLKIMDKNVREQWLRSAEYVAVFPIGTTMFTLYQIMEEVHAQWQGSFPYKSYVLILVGAEGEDNLSSQYWEQEALGCVKLQPQKQGNLPTHCRYYLNPRTKWSNRLCATEEDQVEEAVLVYVDRTSTRPKEIFVVEGSRFRGISYFLKTAPEQAENDRRLALLMGLIHYGHIAEGNNHFQFYLDMERYFSRAQQPDALGKRKTVDLWLQGLRKKVDPNAYNIIVSPLHREDSPFAKAVIDQVFEHSLRFLHIDLSATFREDMRAKFSYISDEYRKIKQFDRDKPVNVYFINTAITSGETLTRARNLATMLMEEAGVPYDRDRIFKGCFVLVNRSAFDTLNSYVKNPEENFWAYLHLAVPSFNSRRDRCPTCELVEQYKALEYSSAGNSLGQEFRRLGVKHSKRTLTKYQVWLNDMVMTGSGYASWLRQWLYSYVNTRRKKEGKLWVGIFEVSEAEYADMKQLYVLLQWGVDMYLEEIGVLPAHGEAYLKGINSFTLTHLRTIVAKNYAVAKDIVQEHLCCLEPEYWKDVLINYVCAQKNDLRLVAIHRSFLRMNTLERQLNGDIPARGRQTAKFLAEMIEQELSRATTLSLQAEWLISYIKVLSRPHLAQYHHVRQGILHLMLQMTAYAIEATDALPEYLSFAKPFLTSEENSVGELIHCQILQTLLKRIAGLQSTYFLHRENMERVLNTFTRLRERFLLRNTNSGTNFQHFNPIPTQEQIEFSMIKLVKWTSSCGDDENGCYLIEESFRYSEEV